MIDPNNSSFRDPDAKVIKQNDEIYRCVFDNYRSNYDLLIQSGLKEELVNEGLLIKEQEINDPSVLRNINEQNIIYKLLKPNIIPFISYPYEWSFTQLKEAALLTLNIQERALSKGLNLKDASAYNVQFKEGKAVFIDSTSFEKYSNGKPWVAYGQFCRHFLGPLLLYKYNLAELTSLQKVYLDGIPLKVISQSLPRSSRFNFAVLTHIHYHSKLEAKYSQNISFRSKELTISLDRLKALIIHLKETIKAIDAPKVTTEWLNYYQLCSYQKDSFEHKKSLVKVFLGNEQRKMLLDIGCNEGEFSLVAKAVSDQVISIDNDSMVIERLSQFIKKNKVSNVLPLVIDISNPSPGIGWENKERASFTERAKFDTVLALAVVHHLAIGNNIPLLRIAEMFSKITNELIIEFVPKEDVQTQRLLVTKKDVFADYNLEVFKKSFGNYYKIVKECQIHGTNRILFLLGKNA